MYKVPVVAIGLEGAWLRGQFEEMVRASGGAAERFTPADTCPPDAVACVILTDDVVSPRLRAALVTARRYLPPEGLSRLLLGLAVRGRCARGSRKRDAPAAGQG